jgi:hypothetical protein
MIMAERKTRQPRPVTDLATAMAALKRAERRAEKADEDYRTAERAHTDAYGELKTAREDVKRYYMEAMGEQVDEAPEGLRDEDNGYVGSEG